MEQSFIRSPSLPLQLMRSLLDIMVKQAVKIREFFHHSLFADGLSDASLYHQASHDEDIVTVKGRILSEWAERRKQ
jgi:hypothetical protein